MTTPEMLESRLYLAEDAMYRRSGELERQLHELESRLTGLNTAVHRARCERGRTPLEVRTGIIVRAIEAFEAGIDLSEIKAKAERLMSLKGLVDGFEREIEASSDVATATPEGGPHLKVLATAS